MTEFDREQSAGYLANHMARLFAQRLAERIRPLGIVPGQFPVLLALWEKDGVTQKHLVEELAVEQPTIANTLARMERDGLVERRTDVSDSRSKRVHLTAKAREIEVPAKEAANAVNALALAALPPETSAEFIAAMRRAIANLSAAAPETEGETAP